MPRAYLGILDNNSYVYTLINKNVNPQTACPIFAQYYKTTVAVRQLLLSMYNTKTIDVPSDNINKMRYVLKHKLTLGCIYQNIDYIYVYHKRLRHWYCFDVDKNGWINQTQLKQYVYQYLKNSK